MNNLCATWHNPADVDLGDEFEPDVVELLSRARDHMEGIGELGDALRLVEVVKKLGGKPAYLVDRMEDIEPAWFQGAKRVGVTSGASTPTQLTRRVIEHIEAMEAPA